MANNKREITQHLLALLGDTPVMLGTQGASFKDVNDAMKIWYVNIRESGGLRLTGIGYAILKTLNIESWTLDLPEKKFSKKILLELDHKLKYPYYIDTRSRKLIFFSSREAMLATLYGDLESFLKQYS